MTSKYDSQGVKVIEVNSMMTSQGELFAWVDGYDYLSLRVEPADQVVLDYRSTQELLVKVYLIIDLTTMKVINSNCGDLPEGGEQCIIDNL